MIALDDALCAGMLIRSLLEGEEGSLFEAAVGGSTLNDGARAALDLAHKYTLDVDFLRSTAAGSALVGIGSYVMLSSICVATMAGLLCWRHLRTSFFWITAIS